MSKVLRSGPFISVNGDRAYLDSFFRDYFRTLIGNGVFADPSDNLQVMADTGMDITVKRGNGWINGAVHLGDRAESLTLDSGSNLDRIDKVVLRMDTIQRTITKQIKKGIPATNPNSPTLQRDDDAYELGLAEITVVSGSDRITQSNIRDLRHNKEQCGIVHGVIEQVDTTTLFNEYQTWLNEKKQEYNEDLITFTNQKKEEISNIKNDFETDIGDYSTNRKSEWDDWFALTSGELEIAWNSWFDTTSSSLENEFTIWFDGVRDTLDGDVAGNLLNLINDIPKIHAGTIEPVEADTGDYWFREVD